jgi:hypothetical protein
LEFRRKPRHQTHDPRTKNWAGNVGSRKSTGGHAFFLGTRLISWSSKKQQIVALSTAEAEYMALTEAIKKGYIYG